MPTLIVLCGLPGTGKSTISRKFDAEGYVIVDQNEIRRKLGMKKMPKHQDHVLREVDGNVLAALIENEFVVVDSVNRFMFRRQQLYGIASACGADVILIECICSEKTAKTRMKSRPNSDGLLSDPNDPAVYDKLALTWDDPVKTDFKWYSGSEHVSYIQYNTETNKVEYKIVQKGKKADLKRLSKIVSKKQ